MARLVRVESLAFEAPSNRPWTAHEFAAELAPGRLFLVAEARGPAADRRHPDLAGYVLFRIIAGEAELLRMAVHPAARGLGLGRALLGRAVGELERQPELSSFLLEVRADNHPAIALYRAFNFALEGRRRGYYPDGQDALLMRREARSERRGDGRA